MSVHVVTVEDDRRYRDSLERLLVRTDEFVLVDSFEAAEPALERLEEMDRAERRVPWDLVLMDLELPGMSGIDALSRIKELRPDTKVVVLTVFEAHGTVLRAICAGADGYLAKRSSSPEILEELRAVLEGGAPLSSGVAHTVLELLRRGEAATPVGEGGAAGAPRSLDLTERERDVLRCLVDGRSYAGAAAELGISENTVRTHVRSVYSKLRVQNVAEAVSRAVREGLI